MRNIVLDTNCLLQMISRRSPYYGAWMAFRAGKYCLCISNEIVSEYHEIITRITNHIVADGVINAILNSPHCRRFDPQFRFGLIEQEPDDNKFVDCAIVADADYIVSDDSHFKILAQIPFPRVNVITLAHFMDDINQESTSI